MAFGRPLTVMRVSVNTLVGPAFRETARTGRGINRTPDYERILVYWLLHYRTQNANGSKGKKFAIAEFGPPKNDIVWEESPFI